MKHLAICVIVKGRREGFVISGPTFSCLERWADTFRNRVGYVGEDDFQTAVRRAGMMERDQPGAWGPLEASNADGSSTDSGEAWLTSREIDEWSPLTQAIAKLLDAHVSVFNEMEATRAKARRRRLMNALGTIYRAAVHLRGR